jgi:hypothetical protein
MEIEEVRKEVEELYRELVRRKYERARKKGVSEQALANFIALHEELYVVRAFRTVGLAI